MTKVVTAPSTSLDGLIAGADDSPEQRLGVDGDRLFSWFSDGDTPSRYYLSFKMSAVSAAFFDEGVVRVGAVIAGRRTYDISKGVGRERTVARRPAEASTWAHQLHLQTGNRLGAVRCAFWLVFRLLNAGDLPSASGWIARIERLLCDAADDSPEVPLVTRAACF